MGCIHKVNLVLPWSPDQLLWAVVWLWKWGQYHWSKIFKLLHSYKTFTLQKMYRGCEFCGGAMNCGSSMHYLLWGQGHLLYSSLGNHYNFIALYRILHKFSSMTLNLGQGHLSLSPVIPLWNAYQSGNSALNPRSQSVHVLHFQHFSSAILKIKSRTLIIDS